MTFKATKERLVKLDALRVLSMLLIVLLHSVDHSGVLEAANDKGGFPYLYTYLIFFLSKISVNCFVLISGYFLVDGKFKLKKLITLWMEVVFYSIFFKLLFMLSGKTPFSLVSLISCFFPVFTGRYWFVTIYFAMYLLSPFYNIAIHAMNKKQLSLCMVLLFVIFSVWISVYPSFAGPNAGRGWGLPWFTVLYFSGAWFRLYYTPMIISNRLKVSAWLLAAVFASVFCYFGNQFLPILKILVWNWYSYDSVPVFIFSLVMFSCFLRMKEPSPGMSSFISKISAATFGIYLIHAHANVSPWIWEKLHLPQFMDSASFPIIHLGSVLLVFFVCAGIDCIRQATIGRIEKLSVIDGISNKTQAMFEDKFHAFVSRD